LHPVQERFSPVNLAINDLPDEFYHESPTLVLCDLITGIRDNLPEHPNLLFSRRHFFFWKGLQKCDIFCCFLVSGIIQRTTEIGKVCMTHSLTVILTAIL